MAAETDFTWGSRLSVSSPALSPPGSSPGPASPQANPCFSKRTAPSKSSGICPLYLIRRVFLVEQCLFSSSSFPSIKSLPFPISSTLSVSASISCISWVVRITVVPCSRFRFFINLLTFSLDTASRPMVGSSRKRIRGLCNREAAISQRIRCPRLKFLTGVLKISFSPKSSVSSSRFLL